MKTFLIWLVVGLAVMTGYSDASSRDHQRIRMLEHRLAREEARLATVNERSWAGYLQATQLVSCVGLQQPVTSSPGQPLVDATAEPDTTQTWSVPIVRENCWRLIIDPASLRADYTMPTGGYR